MKKTALSGFMVFYLRKNRLRWGMLLGILLIYIGTMMLEVKQFCSMSNTQASPWCFALITCNPVTQACFLLGGTVLLCDIPFQIREYYLLTNTSAEDCALHTLIITTIVAAIYSLVLYLFSVITLYPHLVFSSTWGTAISTLGQTDAQMSHLYLWNIPPSVLFQYAPNIANLKAMILLYSCLLFFGNLMSLISALVKSKEIGALIVVAIILLDVHSINQLSTTALWFSPVSLTRIYNLSISSHSGIPYWGYAISFLCGLSILSGGAFATVHIMKVKKSSNRPMPKRDNSLYD